MSWKLKADPQLQMKCHAVASESGYPVEAIMLVLHTLSRLNGGASDSAGDICDTLFKVAASSYGDRAIGSLTGWDLSTSDDVGRVVVALAQAGLVQSQGEHSLSKFENLYSAEDLEQKLAIAGADEQTGASNQSEAKPTTLIPRLVEIHFKPHAIQTLTVTQRNWPYRVRVDLQRSLDQILSTMSVSHFSSVRKEYSHEGLSLHEVMVYKRVVIGVLDPNPRIQGFGERRLLKQG